MLFFRIEENCAFFIGKLVSYRQRVHKKTLFWQWSIMLLLLFSELRYFGAVNLIHLVLKLLNDVIFHDGCI